MLYVSLTLQRTPLTPTNILMLKLICQWPAAQLAELLCMPWVVTFLKSDHIRHAPNLFTADTTEKINTPKATVYFVSPGKLAGSLLLKAVKLSTAKDNNSEHLITCFRHYDSKTRSTMTTAITFSCKMTLVRARALLSIEKISFSQSYLLESKNL